MNNPAKTPAAPGPRYIGQYTHAIDSKGRLFLPAKFRSGGDEYVITRGVENCLFLVDTQGWNRLLERMEGVDRGDALSLRAFRRVMMASAHEAVPDGQGRILIPQHLRSFAALIDQVAVIGAGRRLELWDAARWDAYFKRHAARSFSALAERLDL